MKKAAAIFSILIGLMMFGTWAFLLLSNEFPEIRTLPLESGYLLVAEFLTAAALISRATASLPAGNGHRL